MVLEVKEEEIRFIDSIDAQFPFRDGDKAKELISKGAAISDNAALAIAYELATEPSKRFLKLRLSLLDQLYRERPTRAIIVAAPIINSLIKGISCPAGSMERLLEYCREHEGCYNALGILSLCSAEMKEAADEILKKW